MTTVLDFAMLPPEINSARMYSGAGSSPMLAAASAWKGLSAELRSTALSYGRVLSALTDEEWHGPASAAMASAAMPYVAWMNTTAAQAEQTATQAEAAAAAYDTAFAATVPPPEIAANRAQLPKLVATNTLGHNTPAIAANEAQYAQMWAQDASAMYGYAGILGGRHPADLVHRAAADRQPQRDDGPVRRGDPGGYYFGRHRAEHAVKADVGGSQRVADDGVAVVLVVDDGSKQPPEWVESVRSGVGQ